MQRLSETECKVIELLQEAHPREINKGSILAKIESANSIVNESLDKLVRRNYISTKEEFGFVYYFISEDNKQVKARNVMCPKCKNIRKVFSDFQLIARCKIPECVTPSGKRTVFWLRKRSIKLEAGEIKYLNYA